MSAKILSGGAMIVAERSTRNELGLVPAKARKAAIATTTTIAIILSMLPHGRYQNHTVTLEHGDSLCDDDHPPHAEPVGDHAEARREERLGQWHLHLASFGKRSKEPLGFCFTGRVQGQRKALEARLSLALA